MIGICVTLIGLVKIVEERIAGARILTLEAFREEVHFPYPDLG